MPALAGLVLPILSLEGGLGLVGGCLMGILMPEDMDMQPLLIWDMVIPTMAGAIFRPMDIPMHTHHGGKNKKKF